MSQTTSECTCPDMVMLPIHGFGISVDKSALGTGGSGTTVPGIDYSTEEQWTGKHWLDGKKIYQKTIAFGDLPADTLVTVANGIANIATIVTYEAISILYDGKFTTIPHVGSGGNNMLVGISMDKASIFLQSYAVARTGGGYVTMCYTCTDR